MWHPELVDKIKGYPKTQEDWQRRSDLMRQQVRLYNAEGITGRNGVPDGWKGKKKLINEITEKARTEAVEIVDKMIEEEAFKPDCREARLAMEAAVAIVTAKKHTPDNVPVPLHSTAEVNRALKTILEFTQRKPATSSTVAVTKAEDFLAELAGK